jgi:salicylate hydroxylase
VRVVVVGAGIAGLTLAASLHRRGVPCEVFEQAAVLREVGAGIQIAPNASRLLERLGLAAHLATVGVQPAALEMHRWEDDRLIVRVPLGEECRRQFQAPYYTVHRADLHDGLRALVPTGHVHLGKRCVAVEEGADTVRLQFADGSSTAADVVVGADGIHSVVRASLVADERQFSGQAIYRGVVPSSAVRFLQTEPRVVLWLGPDRHCVCYPVSGGRAVSVGATAPSARGASESWLATGDIAELMAGYADWCSEVRGLLTALDRVGRWSLYDRDPITRWSSQRITLVGDAAHPMLPFVAQGANQAIEDAVALSVLLAHSSAATVGEVLNRYAELRRCRTEEVQRISRRNSSALHVPNGDRRERRDAAIASSQAARERSWLYGFDAEHAALADVAGASRGSSMP